MMQEALSHFPLPLLTCVGLLIFLSVFSGVLLWVFRQGSRDLYQNIQELPLEADSREVSQ